MIISSKKPLEPDLHVAKRNYKYNIHSKGSQQDQDENDIEGELDEDESLCGSSLDFDDNGEGDDSEQEDEKTKDDHKVAQLKSYDKVPTAINEQKFISENNTKPDMMKHFDQIKKDYDISSPEREVQLKDENMTNPSRYTTDYLTSQKKTNKNGSLSSNYSKSFK